MIADVKTEKRKRLTPKQALVLWESQKGICPLCDRKIEAQDQRIDEHLRALGLGGTNDFDNRAFVHKACADAKTHGRNGDLARISKAKRVKLKHINAAAKPIRGLPGASKEDKQAERAKRTAGRVPVPAPRFIYTQTKEPM